MGTSAVTIQRMIPPAPCECPGLSASIDEVWRIRQRIRGPVQRGFSLPIGLIGRLFEKLAIPRRVVDGQCYIVSSAALTTTYSKLH